jgi:DNA-binding transcriptional LysR family regulator
VPERIARTYTELLPLRSLPVPVELNGFVMMQHWHERHHRDPAHVWLRTVIAGLAKEL